MSRIVSEKYIKSANGFWATINWKKELETFLSREGIECYTYQGFIDGHDELQRVFSVKDTSRDILQKGICARVNTAAFDVKLVAGLRDIENTGFDLIIDSKLRISDVRAFLRDYGLERLKSTENITSTTLEAFLADRCKAAITDEAAKHTYDYMRNRDALPIRWWQSNLPRWFGLPWLELVEVSTVHYESKTEDRAAEIKKRQELLELEEAEQVQQHGHELQLKQKQEAFESAKIHIENDRKLSEMEQKLQLDELEQKHQEQALKSKLNMETMQIEAEKRKAELEAEIERLRNNPDSAKEILHKAQESEERNKEIIEVVKKAITEFAEMSAIAKEAVKEGLASKERISVSASGISSKTMEVMGKASGPAYLAQILREKAANTDNAVMMKKIELRSRDIGVKKVDSLRINSSLQFEFLSKRSGYATILNIGTSGKVWLQSPNVYINIEKAKVVAGEKYQVPGQLLPNDDLLQNGLDYKEVGPPGWEELAVIVSDKPLVMGSDIFESTQDCPFTVMFQQRIDVLLDQLSNLQRDEWDVGILSFLVE